MAKTAIIKAGKLLPVLVPRRMVLFPGQVFTFEITESFARFIKSFAERGQRTIACCYKTQYDSSGLDPKDMYDIATECAIQNIERQEQRFLITLKGIARLQLMRFCRTEPHLEAFFETLEEIIGPNDLDIPVRLQIIREGAKKFLPTLPDGEKLLKQFESLNNPGVIADFIVYATTRGAEGYADEIKNLREPRVSERLKTAHTYLNRATVEIEAKSKINERLQHDMERQRHLYLLNEKKKAILDELAEIEAAKNPPEPEEAMEERIKRLQDIAPEAFKAASREYGRLKLMNPATMEAEISRNYLDWILGLPWATATEDREDISEARKILEEDHYGIAKVKKRIIEYLALRKVAKNKKGPILCLIGPPGVGKTSIALSLARVTGRKLVRISLGGVNDEAAIRGHRRTYVGAIPGRIIHGIRKAGTKNPVFVLDEVDKLTSHHGDPSAALLEVLDPEHNFEFSDHFLGVPFDLSQVMFICTANYIETIPPTLFDRLEVITLPGYTIQEKQKIARGFLLRKQLAEHGLAPEEIIMSDKILALVAEDYTREAGVRNLEREIANIIRAIAVKKVSAEPYNTEVAEADIREYLGTKRFEPELAEEDDAIGVSTGLFYSPSGGGILTIETALMYGKGNLIVTGNLIDESSMQESVKIAYSYAKSHVEALGIRREFGKLDVHVNFPSLVSRKDGPSAGLAICTALVSRFTGLPIRKDVAMTGEIDLIGRALPIGGLKEKMLGAHRAGCRVVLYPEKNEKDLADIPDEVKQDLELHSVKNIGEVLEFALVK
jgi:ATP-dependent Lon protease